MPFELFDPDEPLAISNRQLPHWFQPGVTYFITFRTIDSMPRDVLDHWLAERDDWLRRHGIVGENWLTALRTLPPAQQADFHCHFSAAYHDALDMGYGELLLRRKDLAEIVANSLRYFDGTRYHLGDFVVMPNHVHLLVCLFADTEVTALCKSWKKFTATQINRVLGRDGHFWQAESFDHLVRSPEQFSYLQQYIADNPRKAGLRAGDYYLYQLPRSP